MALTGSGDLDHRKQFVVALASATKPLRKPGADTVRQMPGRPVKTRRGRSMSGITFVPKPDVREPRPLREARHVGDRNADHP